MFTSLFIRVAGSAENLIEKLQNELASEGDVKRAFQMKSGHRKRPEEN